MNEHSSAIHARLLDSRREIFGIAHAMKGDEPGQSARGACAAFPRSRVMRALLSPQSRVLLGGAAVAAVALRPRLLGRAIRLAPMLRPVIMRYLLPRLLRRR